MSVFSSFEVSKALRFFKKMQDWTPLNPEESENGFCVSLQNRSIHDLSVHGASNEPKNPLPEWIVRFCFRILSDLRIQSGIF